MSLQSMSPIFKMISYYFSCLSYLFSFVFFEEAFVNTMSQNDFEHQMECARRDLMWPDLDVAVPNYAKKQIIQTLQSKEVAPEEIKKLKQELSSPSPIVADNVCGLQGTRVAGMFFPQTIEDVRTVLLLAKKYNKKVCMRGTAHCMSRATMAPNAMIIDFKYLNNVEPMPEKGLVRCGPGAQWCHLITALNPYGQSPRTMQSYSSFSVGGSLGCNAHGITTDFCCAESVHSIDVMKHDGTVVTCRADSEPTSDEGILFRHVIGGFGLCGIIVSLVLRTTPNDALLADSFMCSVDDFPNMYKAILDENNATKASISVKLARLNILTCNTVQVCQIIFL